jgi:hypothetical protein
LIYIIQGGNNVSLGLNKQTYNMARLKVKQISDIQGYVQNLIDTDADQNATLISNNASSISDVSTALANEIASTGAEVTALEASVDSLELIGSGNTAATDASIDSLELIDQGLASDIADTVASTATNTAGIAQNVKDISDLSSGLATNDADNLALTASVDSLELVDAGLAGDISDLAASVATNDTRVDAILSGADLDLDQFIEVVAYVDSMDVLQGGQLTTGLAAANASIDSLELVDAGLNTSIAANIKAISDVSADLVANDEDNLALTASVDSLELVVGGNSGAADASIDSLEVVASAAIDSIDLLQAADVVIDASIDSLEALATDAFGAGVRIHQMGTVTGTTTFTIPLAVDSTVDADCVVFVNGKNEQMFMVELNTNGWVSADGLSFSLSGIGYDIDAEDDVYVIAPYAGVEGGSGGGSDYEDFFNGRK